MELIADNLSIYDAYNYIKAIMVKEFSGTESDLENPIVKNYYETTKKRDVKQRERKVFTVPTIDEIRKYIKDNNFTVNAEVFYSYYKERDWHYNSGKPVIDWQASILRWHKNNFENQKITTWQPDSNDVDSFFDMAYNRG